MIIHRSSSDSKSPQVPKTLLSTLADLNNAVVCMVLISPPISNSSSIISKLLVAIPSVLITSGITITLMFCSFYSSLARSKYLSHFFFFFFFFAFFDFQFMVHRNEETHYWVGSFFFSSFFFFCLFITRSGLLAGIRWSVCIS